MTTTKPPAWFWVVSIFALLWNIMGVMAYLAQVMMPPEVRAAMPEAQQEMYANTPAWATRAFALAVFSGALGCLILLFRKAFATYLLILSFACIIVQNIYNFFLSNHVEVMGNQAIWFPIAVILIGAFLIAFARRSTSQGWLN